MSHRTRILALVCLLPLGACAGFMAPNSEPTRDKWLAEDKLKHFTASFVATSLSAGAARAAGLDVDQSMWVGVGVGAGFGVWKELRDLHRKDDTFSLRDLAWDFAGDAAAAALVRQVR